MEKKTKKAGSSDEVVIRLDDSSNVIESLIFTRAQSYSDVYRFRFMLELVKVAQECIRQNFDHVLNGEKITSGEYRYAELSFPIRNILFSDGDKNYEKAKRSLLRLKDWVLVEDTGEKFRMMPVLSFAEMDRYESLLRVEIRKNLWDLFMDFSKGYSEYNPEVILRLTSPFGRQFYKGLRNQKGVVSYTIDSLKRTFGYYGKYEGRDMLFLHRVVDRAREELDMLADFSFTYEVVYGHGRGQRGRKCIERVDFRSVRRVGNESDDAVRKMLHPAQIVGNAAYHILTDKLFFTFAEVKGNVKLFAMAARNLGEASFVEWLERIVPKACRARTSTQGYVVNSLKRLLHDRFGIVYGKPVILSEAEEAAPAGVDVQEAGKAEPRKALAGPSVEARKPLGAGLDDNQYVIGDIFAKLFD